VTRTPGLLLGRLLLWGLVLAAVALLVLCWLNFARGMDG
jgi:hypothetical protein